MTPYELTIYLFVFFAFCVLWEAFHKIELWNIHIHTCTHTDIHTHITHAYIHTRMRAHMHAYMRRSSARKMGCCLGRSKPSSEEEGIDLERSARVTRASLRWTRLANRVVDRDRLVGWVIAANEPF